MSNNFWIGFGTGMVVAQRKRTRAAGRTIAQKSRASRSNGEGSGMVMPAVEENRVEVNVMDVERTEKAAETQFTAR